MTEKIDRFQLYMLRLGKEKSRALPVDTYKNPARTVKFASETKKPKEKYER